MSNSHVTQFLFFYETCETPKKENNKKNYKLSIQEEIKRFDVIVVDGTADGIFGNLPRHQRATKLLTCSDDIWKLKRTLSTPGHMKAVKILFVQCRSAI